MSPSRPLAAWLAAALALTSFSGGGVAHAQTSGDTQQANALFEEGKSLMAAQRYREACQRFEGSEALVASGRALLNLADCLEKDGRFASAWTKFRASAARAHEAGVADIERYANDRAAALAPRVARLVLSPSPADAPTLTITVDGQAVDRSLWAGFPVDPGAHAVLVTARGKRTWNDNIVVDPSGARFTAAIPALDDDATVLAPFGPAPATAPAGGEAREGGHDGSTQRIVALAAGGVGVVALGAGIIMGLSAKSSYDDATSMDCGPKVGGATPNDCNAQGVSGRSSAGTKADVATAAFIVGGAALAGGAVLWFTAPSRANVSVGMTPAGFVLRGSF